MFDVRRLFKSPSPPPYLIATLILSTPVLLAAPGSYPGRLHDLELVFKRDYTQLSRLFAEVMDFMMSEHGHRINNYLVYWEPLFETMADVVEAKGVCLEMFVCKG